MRCLVDRPHSALMASTNGPAALTIAAPRCSAPRRCRSRAGAPASDRRLAGRSGARRSWLPWPRPRSPIARTRTRTASRCRRDRRLGTGSHPARWPCRSPVLLVSPVRRHRPSAAVCRTSRFPNRQRLPARRTTARTATSDRGRRGSRSPSHCRDTPSSIGCAIGTARTPVAARSARGTRSRPTPGWTTLAGEAAEVTTVDQGDRRPHRPGRRRWRRRR